MTFLNNIGVRNKLWLLLAVALLGTFFVQVFSGLQTRHYLMEGRKQEIKYLVDNTVTLIDHFYQQKIKWVKKMRNSWHLMPYVRCATTMVKDIFGLMISR
jgi:hypothetical protein